jgi:hypothetical protein
LAFRMLWLIKVKRMDWKKVLYGAVAAFVGGAAAAFAVAAEGGITGNEWAVIVGAGFAAVSLYLKDPNAHRGKDPRNNGSTNPFKK